MHGSGLSGARLLYGLAHPAGLAPLFAGIIHARLDREGPLHWPCRSSSDPGEATLYLDGFATPNGRAQLATRPYLPPGEEATRPTRSR